MIREMNLHNEPFNLIKQGTKTYITKQRLKFAHIVENGDPTF